MPGPLDLAVRRALAPARREVGVIVAAGVVGAGLLIAQAFIVARLILSAIGPGEVWPWALATVGLLAARAGIAAISDLAAARAAARVGAAVRRRVMGRLLGTDPGRSGAAAALATRGASAVEPYLTRYVPTLVLAGVLPPLVLVALAVTDPASALVVVVTLPLIPVFGILVGLATRDEATSQWRAMADLAGHFLDVMRGLPTLVAFNRAEAQSGVIAAVTERYRVRMIRTLRIAFASSAVLELVATLSVAVVAVTIGLRLAGGSIPLSVALPVLLLAPEAYWPLRKVGAEFHAAAEGVAVFEELTGEATEPTPSPAAPASAGVPTIELDGVGFTWPDRQAPALAPVSLRLDGPGMTAVVGPSGAGKSTLIALLGGELTPTVGTLSPLPRASVAWLPQRPVFLDDTVAANLRLARPEATDAELDRVLDRVGLRPRITDLAARVSEDGLALSAGERARLALARILLAERPVVLLDEPTAHLDPATEDVIAAVVRDLARTSRVIVVAHRPTLIDLADSVLTVTPPRTSPLTPAAETRLSARRNPPFGASSPAFPSDDGEPQPRRRRFWSRFAWVLDGLAVASGVALTATAGWLIVRAAAEPAFLTLMVAIVGVRTFGIARPVLRYAERLASHDGALRRLARTRVEVYDALVPLVPGRLRRARGDVLATVVDDVDAVLDRELRVRTPVRGYALMAVLITATTVLLDPVSGLVIAALTASGGVVFALARRGAARAEHDAVTGRARISELVTEAVQTAAERRRWQAADPVLDRLDVLGEEAGAAARGSAAWSALARAFALVAAALAMGVIAALSSSGTTVGAPVAALLILTPLALADPIASLADAGVAAARAAAAQARLDALLSQPPAVVETEAPAPISGAVLTLDRPAVRRGERLLLAEVEARLPVGGVLAVRGANGSGKSTLAALLLRFLDPDTGAVRLGGTDLREAAAADVRTTVGLVDDDPHVFASTLAENVRFARPGSSDDDVVGALREAQLGEWLAELPDGLETRLGDGYAAVSGGERARLGIARSLLARQQVLVLDEPTAHLDTATADRLRDEVGGPGRPPTRSVVWIAHDAYPDADVTIELSPGA